MKTPIIKSAFIGFLLFVISISCSTSPITTLNQITVPLDYFGIEGGGSGIVEEYQLLNEMRPAWLLKTFYWSAIEKEKGVFDFSPYDNSVNDIRAQGIKIIAVLAYAAPWLNDGKNNKYISGKNIQYFLNYIEAIVTHYKGKIDAWQIWNEPNWIFWRGTNKEFYELSKLTAQKIREIDPDAYIIGGGFLRHPYNFILNMKNSGAMENLDALSIHPYAVNPKGSMRLLDIFFKTVLEIDFNGDIWITEVGYPTSGWYPSRVSLRKMPTYVIKTIAQAAARRIRGIVWYDLKDSYKYGEYPNNFDSELYFGLVYSDFSRKSGAWAYELCARYLPGSRYNPELPIKEGIKSNIVTLCFTGNESDTNTLIIWNDKNTKQKIKVTIPSLITIHDISSADNYSLQNEAIVEITDKPVFITWQGSSIPHISIIRK